MNALEMEARFHQRVEVSLFYVFNITFFNLCIHVTSVTATFFLY